MIGTGTMKQFTIRLPDDLFDKLDQMQNKGAFVRSLIEREIDSSGEDDIPSLQTSSDLRDEVRSLNERVKEMGYKIDSIYSMLNTTQNTRKSSIPEMTSGIGDEETDKIETGKNEYKEFGKRNPTNIKELERSILMYIPPGSEIRHDVVRNLLSKKYDIDEIEGRLKQMIDSGTILKVTKDGSNYLTRG